MRSIWSWWKRKSEDRDLDEWVQNWLPGEVPEGSFEGVWAQVARRIEAAPVPGKTHGELAVMPPGERRGRLWDRSKDASLKETELYISYNLLSDHRIIYSIDIL